jgi:uncharacterized protein
MPIIASRFKPHPLLRNRHLQTLWQQVMRPPPASDLDRERLELPDGDFLDLCWSRPKEGPIVVLLHGLNGGLHSAYSGPMIRAFVAAGFRVLFLHFRGCSGEPNRLPRSYHSGETGDLSRVLDMLEKRFPGTPRVALGVSLGGNVLLKYLGERGSDAGLAAAAAVSVPFTLADAAQTLQKGFARLYQAYLLRGLIRSTRRKFRQLAPPFPLPDPGSMRTLRDFDDRITAPLHGFRGAEDYYARSSSRQFLSGVRIPTLVLHALDDPFMTRAGIPHECELAESLELELSERGGHAGFVAAGSGLLPRFWPAQRVPAYLSSQIKHSRGLRATDSRTTKDPASAAAPARRG